MGQTIQVRRGPAANLPATAAPGEPLYTTDTKQLYIGNGDGAALTTVSGGGGRPAQVSGTVTPGDLAVWGDTGDTLVDGGAAGGGHGGGTVTHAGGALATDQPVFGSGGGDIKTGSKSGNTDKVATVAGAVTTGDLAVWDASGNLVNGGSPSSGAGSGTVTHNSGALTTGLPIFGNGGADITVGAKSGNTATVVTAGSGTPAAGKPLLYDGSGNAVPGATAQLVPALPSDATKYLDGTGAFTVPAGGAGTVTHTGGALTADLPVFGAGTADIKVGTKSGNTDEIATVSGALTNGHALVADASGNVVDGGAAPVALPIAESSVTGLVSDLAAKAPSARQISTTAPLTGGGDLSADRTLAISNFTGDTGSGGAKGAVPAPASGDAAAGKFLKADGTWAAPAGGGSTLYFGRDSATVSGATNTVTFGSTPVTNSGLVFVNGLWVAYTASGAVITLAEWLGSGVVSAQWATTNATPGGITLSAVGSPPNPVVRGTGIQASSAGSYTVNWPSGTVAGDLAIICAGHGYSVSTPSGWTPNDSQSGANWNGAVFSRVLTSGDITTGSVAVSMGGSFDGTIAIVTFNGATFGIRETVGIRSGSGTSSQPITTSGAVVSTDTLIYFLSNRAASTDTVSRGTLQQTANDSSSASGALYTEAMVASGAQTATFLYSTPGSGYYQAVIVVKGI